MRRCIAFLHGKLSYPVGSGRVTVGETLLPLIPANEIFYDAPKLRARLDKDGYLYFKNIIPREVVNTALDDLANQMRHCGWTLEKDRQRLIQQNGFAVGVPYPSQGGELPPPAIEYSDAMRAAVSGTSVMAVVRQVFGGTVNAATLQSLQLAAPHEASGFRMPCVFANKGTKLALTALVPLHDTPMHMGTPLVVRGSNHTDSYTRIRHTYGQWEVESGDIRGDGCFTMSPDELTPIGKQPGHDEVTGAPVVVDVNPLLSCTFEAGDLLLMTVYTMHSFLTNQTLYWRILGEATWTMDGDDVGPDPRYVGENAPGLGSWFAQRDDPAVYPKSIEKAKREWGLVPGVNIDAEKDGKKSD